MSPISGILRKSGFNPKLLNNPLASWFLINLDILLSHTAHFDRPIILPLFVYSLYNKNKN